MFERMAFAGRVSSWPAGSRSLDILRIFSSVTHRFSLNVQVVGVLPASPQASQVLIFAASLNETIFVPSAHAHPTARAAPNRIVVLQFMPSSIPQIVPRVTPLRHAPEAESGVAA